jgi:transcriptional regulator with PAS, ATPase and Fis domain
MKKDLTDLKKVVVDLIENDNQLNQDFQPENETIIKKLYQEVGTPETPITLGYNQPTQVKHQEEKSKVIEVEESLSLADMEEKLIRKALIKYKNKRNKAAKELGISDRTLYRKIDEYGIQ